MEVRKPANVVATTVSPHSILLTWENKDQYDFLDIQRKATIQTLDLLEGGYVNCVATDIGKQVKDDTVEIGVLVAYNNTTREWVISTSSTVVDASAMTITGGTGAGTADGNSTPDAWGLLTVIDDGTETSYLDDNLGEDLYIATEYCYKIRGCMREGEEEYYSDWTDEECTTTFAGLEAPTELIATAITDTIVDLIFVINSSDEDNVCVERKLHSAGWNDDELSPLLAKRRDSFRNTGLTKGETYDYRVRVKKTDPLEYSGFSNVAEITTIDNPSAPTILTISEKEDKKLRLGWTDNSDDETGFKIEQSATGDFTGEEETIAVVGADVLTYLVKGLTPSTPYWFRVCAYNAAGDSTYSNTATSTMLPAYIPTPFEKWIRNPGIEAVILCEINPGIELSGFTLVSSKTYTYELIITDRAVVDFEKVYEDGDEYTEKSSINEVEATASTYWFDPATRKIYVHTSNGTNPSNFFIEGRFWIRFANKEKTFNGNFYYPFLTLENIPSMSQEISPIYTGLFTISSGTISLKNDTETTENFFDTRFADYLWRDAKVVLKSGKEGFTYTQHKEVFTSLIDRVSCNDLLFSFNLKDLRANLAGKIPMKKYSITDFPHMDTAQKGKIIPIVFRRRSDIVPVCIHRDFKRWKFHDGPDYPIAGLHKVTVNDVEKVADTDYYVDYQRGIITFDDSVEIDWEKDIIGVDFTGVVDLAKAQLENGAEIFKFIMNRMMGLVNGELNLDSIYETKHAYDKKLSFAIVKEENLGDIIHRIENSTKSWSFQDELGRIGLQIAQTAPPSNVVYVENFHIAEGGHSQEKGTDYIFKEINVYYSESIMEGKKEWKIYTKLLPAFVNKYGKRKPLESLDVYTYFINVPPAEELANDIASILEQLEGGSIHETLPWVLYGCRVGDLIKLSRDRFYSSPGAASEITVRLLKLDKGIASGKSTIKGVVIS